MNQNFLSSNSFKVRARVSIGIFLIVILGALTPNAIGLRTAYSIAAILSLIEVYTLMTPNRRFAWYNLLHSFITVVVLTLSIVAVQILPRSLLSIGIVLTFTSDVGAYMVGKICGTKLIHARPFPTISPNKSWEGIIGGLLVPGLAVPLCNYFFGESFPGQPLPILAGCLAGLCAIVGDTSESAFKRQLVVKDANDVLRTQPGFRHIEALLGGSEGHGGYFDRLDSMSMVLLLFGIVTVLSDFLPRG